MYRIVRGVVRDFPLTGNYYRQGWWWHCTDTPKDWAYGYDPEGPFLTKEYARRHLLNTRRLHRVAKRTGRWPRMPSNAGWCPGWGGRIAKPIQKPVSNLKFFGQKFRNYLKENERTYD